VWKLGDKIVLAVAVVMAIAMAVVVATK